MLPSGEFNTRSMLVENSFVIRSLLDRQARNFDVLRATMLVENSFVIRSLLDRQARNFEDFVSLSREGP